MLTIARTSQVGKVDRNRRLITRDTWEIAMKAYRQRRQKETTAAGFDLVPVTISAPLDYSKQMDQMNMIDPKMIVGFATRIGCETIDVRFHSADTFAKVKELVLHENYKAALRYFAKLRQKTLSELEKAFYETDFDTVSELYDLQITCFNLIQ